MLLLDDPRWKELRHAYGNATDLPDLLRTLASSPGPKRDAEDEPWFSIWSRLCHQGDVFTASYAAIPHIVSIARNAVEPIDFSFFQLPAAVEVARQAGRGPQLPEDLAGEYHRSIALLIDNASLHRNDAWDRSMLLSVAAAQAVAKGHIDIAAALLNLDADWIAKINDDEFD